jgi:ribosome-associated translation inhibitor RaiA
MQIVSRGQNVQVSNNLIAHCLERARRAFRPFSARVSLVKLVFVELSGSRRGLGRACRVTVQLVGGGQVHYEGRAEDFYQCASQAIMGTTRHIQRALERRRSFAEASSSLAPFTA